MRTLLTLMATLCFLAGMGGLNSWAAEPGKAAAPAKDTSKQSVLECLQADGHFKILLAALQHTDLEKTLSKPGRFTFLAPMDEAFGRVPQLERLLDDPERLAQVLNRHLLPDREMDLAALREKTELYPLAGEPLKVDAKGKDLEINDAKILIPDVRASNGILHGIDHVLMKNNDSMLREAAEAVEQGLKKGAEKVKEAVKGDNEKKAE